MAGWEKSLRAMFASANPCTFSYEDCARVLRRLNFVEAPNSGTSHRKWVLVRDGEPRLFVGLRKPSSGPVGKEYVKDMLRVIRENGLFTDGREE